MAWSNWSTNRKTWKLNFMPGAPPYWIIGCPHHFGSLGTYGSSWIFYIEGGKVKNWYGAYPGVDFHKWP